MNETPTLQETLRIGTLLFEEGAQLPEPLQLGRGMMGTGWAAVTDNLDRLQMERKFSAAGWTFFFKAHSIQCSAFGFDRTQALQKALRRLITAVEQEKCNAMEIDRLAVRSYFGFPFVKLSAHARHIQKSMVLGGVYDGHSRAD